MNQAPSSRAAQVCSFVGFVIGLVVMLGGNRLTGVIPGGAIGGAIGGGVGAMLGSLVGKALFPSP